MTKDNILIEYLNFLSETDSADKTSKIKKYYHQKRKELEKRKKEAIDRVKDFMVAVGYKSTGQGELDDLVTAKEDQILKYFAKRKAALNASELKALKLVKGSTLLASGAAIASIIIINSVKIYKEQEQKYKRQCSKYTSKYRARCIAAAKIDCLKQKNDFLEMSYFKCKKSNNPVECKAKLDKEVLKVKEQLRDKMNDFSKDIRSREGGGEFF
jgi:hypothetical protein